MSPFLKFVFLLFLYFGSSQENKESYSKKISQEFYYYHDKSGEAKVNEVVNEEFLPFNTTFPGLQDEVFWFKVNLSLEEVIQDKIYFLINSVSLHSLELFEQNGNEYQKIYSFAKNGQKKLEIPIQLTLNRNFLFKANFTKSIYFPVSLVNESAKKEIDTTNLISYGVYYTFTLLVLLINLFFFFQTRERFFLYYTFLSLSIGLILFELDGLFFALFGKASWILSIDMVLHSFLLISLMFFTNEAIQLKQNMPKLVLISKAIVFFSIISFFIYFITDVLFWYSLGEAFNALGILLYWVASLLLFRKYVFARFMFIGYSVIYVLNIVYVLPSEFGMIDFGLSPQGFKLGSAFEMIVFLYAISYRYKKEVEEKQFYENKIEIQDKKLKKVLLKKEEQVKRNIEKYNLTKREKEIVMLVIDGDTNKKIADKLFITESTIKFHLTKIFVKTEVNKRTELIKILSIDT